MTGPWLKSALKQTDEDLVAGAKASADSYTEAAPPDWAGIGTAAAQALAQSAMRPKNVEPTPKETIERNIKERNESELYLNSKLKKDTDASNVAVEKRVKATLASMRPEIKSIPDLKSEAPKKEE